MRKIYANQTASQAWKRAVKNGLTTKSFREWIEEKKKQGIVFPDKRVNDLMGAVMSAEGEENGSSDKAEVPNEKSPTVMKKLKSVKGNTLVFAGVTIVSAVLINEFVIKRKVKKA